MPDQNIGFVYDDSGYRDRYVGLLDILGFSELTERADNHPNWRAWLRDCINALNQTVPAHNEMNGFRFAQFSDTIVMSAFRTPQGLLGLFSACIMLSTNMLNRGILLRGGLAAGNFHHDEQMMFGPALIRAYAHDKRGAPPHIALDESILEDVKPSLIGPSFLPWVTSDPWDLSPMLHTLHSYENYDAVPAEGAVVLDEEAFNLARHFQMQASDMSHPPAVRAKWRWTQDYWNRSVAPKGILLQSRYEPDWDRAHSKMQQAAASRYLTWQAHQAALDASQHD